MRQTKVDGNYEGKYAEGKERKTERKKESLKYYFHSSKDPCRLFFY